MNEAIQSWMERAAGGGGVLACGVRLANRSVRVKSSRGGFSEQQLLQAMRDLFEAAYALQQNRIAAERLCWTFENSRIYCVTRPGGVMAALLVSTETASAAEVDQLLAEAPLAEKS